MREISFISCMKVKFSRNVEHTNYFMTLRVKTVTLNVPL